MARTAPYLEAATKNDMSMRLNPQWLALWLLIVLNPLSLRGETKTLKIIFEPESPQFSAAAQEYEALWAREGRLITAVMEAASGLKFEDREVRAIVRETPSDSGYKEKPMHLRASYPLDTKRATLIHELGHRLESDFFRKGEDDHKYLFLWIYDVWAKLYGPAFADAQVEVERRRGNMYPAAWDFALALNPKQRAAKWKEVLAERRTRNRPAQPANSLPLTR